jgi:hypothetical protein
MPAVAKLMAGFPNPYRSRSLSAPSSAMLVVRVISQSRKNTSLLRKQNNRIHDRTGVFIPILLINVNELATDLRKWTVLEGKAHNGL